MVVAVAALLAAAAAVGVGYLLAVATEDRLSLAQRVAQACTGGGPAARELTATGACGQAEQVIANPAPVLIGPPAPGLDTAAVLALIRAELDALGLPPGRLPEPEQVRAAAEQVLTSNPDLFRGPPPDPAQLDALTAAAVAAFFAANPVSDGTDGTDGAAGVDGVDGGQGPQGVSLTGLMFEARDGACLAVLVTLDPATGGVGELTAPVPDPFCGQDPPPAPEPTADPDPAPADPGPDGGDPGGTPAPSTPPGLLGP